MIRHMRFLCAVLLVCLCSVAADATDPAGNASQAVVTALEGTARVYTKEQSRGRALRKGDRISRQQEVRVGERSRTEIRFPDGTVMRLAEKSRLAMAEVQFDKTTESKNVKVNLGLGKLWANVKKLVTPDSAVEVNTGNAVAGVRGTVYRVNVEDDKTAVVKVYEGTVYVANPPNAEPGKPPAQVSAPVPVPGPHEVPPPVHEVTMEEWHVIVKAMQQVVISPGGTAAAPQEFDPKADADDWVLWNQERDKQVLF